MRPFEQEGPFRAPLGITKPLWRYETHGGVSGDCLVGLAHSIKRAPSTCQADSGPSSNSPRATDARHSAFAATLRSPGLGSCGSPEPTLADRAVRHRGSRRHLPKAGELSPLFLAVPSVNGAAMYITSSRHVTRASNGLQWRLRDGHPRRRASLVGCEPPPPCVTPDAHALHRLFRVAACAPWSRFPDLAAGHVPPGHVPQFSSPALAVVRRASPIRTLFPRHRVF